MNDAEKLRYLELAIEKISKMPLVKGIGVLENMYNSVVQLAKDVHNDINK